MAIEPAMIETLQQLIETLRHELQQYGEMLALMDREQDLIVQRSSQELFDTVSAIQSQAGFIQNARSRRDQVRAELAERLGRSSDASFEEIVPLVPPEYRPLLDALVRENNQLLFRVQQRARQNHLLLSRSLELMQRFLSTLFPTRDNQVYNDHGTRPIWAPTLRPLYEAVG
jgi:flagellar biosynthesis/type III secretory pathway chaperone